MAVKEVTRPQAQESESKQVTHPRHFRPFEEMERMFGSMFPRARMRPLDWEWPSWAEMSSMAEGKTPRLDIVERDNEVMVRAELAGVDKKDIDVSLTDNTVTIRGHTKSEHKEEKGDFYRCEISRGEFARTASLPCDVDGDRAEARFADGILELTIPKMEHSKRRTIKVQ